MIAGIPILKLIFSPWILVLILVSIVSVGTMLDRIIYFGRLKLDAPRFLRQVKELIKGKQLTKATELCESINHPIPRLARDMIQTANLPRAQIFSSIERARARELQVISSHVGVLSVVSFIGPLLGLLGTVVGIVQAFAALAETGGGSPTAMMAGIAVALVTTACGIAIAVPAAIAYGIFSGKVDAIDHQMEMVGLSIIRTLSERGLIDISVSQKVRKKQEVPQKANPSEASEALTPGINMALLLICFFMLFVPNMYQSNFTVSTPALSKTKQKQKEKKEKTELKLNIYMAADGSVFINNQLMPPDVAVQDELMRQLLLRSLKRLCIISADETLFHWQVVDLMDRATVCGAEKVLLLKRSRSKKG